MVNLSRAGNPPLLTAVKSWGKRRVPVLHRRDATERQVGAIEVVRPGPAGGVVLRLTVRSSRTGCGLTGVAYGSAVAFRVRVLLRLVRLDVVDPDAVALSPNQQCTADVLRAVVAADQCPRRNGFRGDL